MEKLSGLVLDLYDDETGAVLRTLYPKKDDLPEVFKTAALVPREDLDTLPDDLFALVLRQEGATLRKYACVSPESTALNIGYFLLTHEKLPAEAVKVAATNLTTACSWYDIEPPEELRKLSTGDVPSIGRQRVWKELDGATYHSSGQSWGLEKDAEVIGTADMPLQASKGQVASKAAPLSVAKTAAETDAILEQAFVRGESPEALPQMKMPKVMQPHVDVAGKEPCASVQEKKAQYFALPHLRRYPLDTYEQVKAASLYFDQYYKMMPPDDRHTYAVHLLQRTTPLDIEVSKEAAWYGQTGYAPDAHIDICVEQRLFLLAPHLDGFNEQTKVASKHCIGLYQELATQRPLYSPALFARTLMEIDKIAGLEEFYDRDIYDPFFATFGKKAEADETKDTLVLGNEYMRAQDLKAFAVKGVGTLQKTFGEEFVEEFQKDPAGIFESLPIDQKLMVMRMVNQSVETRASA